MQQAGDVEATRWWQLDIPVPAHLAEDASAVLIEAGALGVLTREVGHTTYVVACYAADAPAETLRNDGLAALGELGIAVDPAGVQLTQQDDADWAERWKQYFKPLKVGRRLWIVPSWDKKFVSPRGSIVLQLDPGTAFGTGQHATTSLCLRAVERYFDTRTAQLRRQARVLDVGCGTGVLGLAAAKLGARTVLGVDTDPQAIAATQHNAAANGMAHVLQGEATPLGEVSGTYQLVVANILAPTLIALAPMLLRRLAPGGEMLLSGILRDQADDVVAATLQAAERIGMPLAHSKTSVQGDWVVLQFAHGAHGTVSLQTPLAR
jgi:ribosomal protein L11 methyltransferase